MKKKLFSRTGYLVLAFLAALAPFFTSCEKDETTKPEPPKPSLKLNYMEVVEVPLAGELYLYGYFGDSTKNGEVLINNMSVGRSDTTFSGRIISWKPWLIVCKIPDANKPNGRGKVQVRNQGLVSNTRKLTVWHGDINFHRPDQGTLKRDVQFSAYLRADADAHQYPAPLQQPTHFASGSKAHYSIGGQGVSTYNAGCNVTLTATLSPASGTINPTFPITERPDMTEYFSSRIFFRNNRFEIERLEFYKQNVNTLTMNAVYCSETSTVQSEYDLLGLPSAFESFTLELEPGTKNIKPGRLTLMSSTEVGLVWDEGRVPQYECTLSWGTIKPIN
jgi:hypothetical protein